ncbi:MAG: helix-turn-helix transcriptional regulator [Mariniphaga sp.]
MRNQIRVERAKTDITQAELAEKIGVSRQTINSIELGKFVPSTILALKLAGFFGIKVEELFMLEADDWE